MTLADRVYEFVVEHPGRTAYDIALAVRARKQDVRDVLDSDAFSAAVGPDRSLCYTAVPGRVPAVPVKQDSKETDCAFLLRILSDGRPHTLNEILRLSFLERGHGLTVHSRAAELRTKHGYNVENRRDKDADRGDGSVYQLLAGPLETAPASSRSAGAASSGAEAAQPDAAQLTVYDAIGAAA